MKKLLTLFAFIFSLFPHLSNAQIITTIAGNGMSGFSGDGGPASAAELAGANNVTIDSSGNLFISEVGNQRIRKVNAVTGIITTIAGNGSAGYNGDGIPATLAELNGPFGIALDKQGNLYFAECSNNRIRKIISSNGYIVTVAGNGAQGFSGDGGAATLAELYNPTGVAIDTSGNIAIADAFNNRIRLVNTLGKITTLVGNGASGYSGDGGPAWNAELYDPECVRYDAANNLYFSDHGNNCIREVFGFSYTILTIAGGGGSLGDGGPATKALLTFPGGICLDKEGNLFIGDFNDNRVREVDVSGTINTIAGNGWNSGPPFFYGSYSGDGGAATLAELNNPTGVAVDKLGNIYVADERNLRVRKVSVPAGINEITNSTSVNIFPNPSNGKFNVSFSHDEFVSASQTITVYNILGEVVSTESLRSCQDDNVIDLSSQPNGIYLYKITTNNGELIGEGKLIIQK